MCRKRYLLDTWFFAWLHINKWMLIIDECFQNCQSCKYFRHIQIANCVHICFPIYCLWFAMNYNQTASKKHWQPSYGCYLTCDDTPTWLPHARKSNYSTFVQISISSTLWKPWMKNSMKNLHFTFAGWIANWSLLFEVWKKINATQLGLRCQTFWNHFRNALQTHEDLLRRCRRMKPLIFKEKC